MNWSKTRPAHKPQANRSLTADVQNIVNSGGDQAGTASSKKQHYLRRGTMQDTRSRQSSINSNVDPTMVKDKIYQRMLLKMGK